MILPYVLAAQLMFILCYIKNSQYNHVFYVVFMFFLCGTYYNGSDWRVYEILYNDPRLFSSYEHWGGGIKYVFEFFSFVGFSFHAAIILCKMFVFTCVCYFIQRYSQSPLIAFYIFVMLSGYGLFIDNPFRQMLAIPFYLGLLIYAIEKKPVAYVFSFLIGLLFHSSIIFFLPLYFICNYKVKLKGIIAFLLVVYILCIFDSILYFFVDNISRFVPIVSFYARHYLEESGRLFNVSSLVYILILIFVLRCERISNREHSKTDNLFRILFILYVAVVFMSMRIPDILRFTYYLGVPFAIYVSNLIYNHRLTKLVILTLSLVLSMNVVMSEYKYVPYTNYIYSYMFSDLKDYDYRYYYHYIYHGFK